ncbi:MAG: TRAP transporter substrate-binding protein [Lachnospiraceae bacterium]|nr:TRAP transporter substrate-binding protein [Lachnospiraceae bacterium]
MNRTIKKSIIMFCAVTVTTVMLAGCGASGSPEGESVVLKAGFSTGASDPRVVATELFKSEVEAATDGRISVEIHTDGELGSDSELISGVVNGEIDITASSAGNFASYAPNVGISAFPFLFDDFEQAWKFVDGDTETHAEAELSDYNVKVLAHYDNGFRCVTTSESAGPVESVSDMDGLIIRTPENQIVMQTMLLLGAEPKVLGFAELYEALKKGEFDAQENPIPVIYNNNLYEVQSNLAITNHSYDVMLFVIRQDIWDKLSAGDQEIIMAAAAKAQAKDRELIKSQTEEYIQKLEEAGMNVTYPDLAEFKEATSSAVDYFADSYDAELLNEIR